MKKHSATLLWGTVTTKPPAGRRPNEEKWNTLVYTTSKRQASYNGIFKLCNNVPVGKQFELYRPVWERKRN
jgi:hypothetical protein